MRSNAHDCSKNWFQKSVLHDSIRVRWFLLWGHKTCYPKIYVSCKAFVNFQDMSQRAMTCRAMCSVEGRQALQMRFAKRTLHDTSKAPAMPNTPWKSPKCCACHKNPDNFLKHVIFKPQSDTFLQQSPLVRP